jgi:hypothetical protein
MKVSGRQQILVACLGLVVGSGLVFAHFLGWVVVPVASLGAGSALLFYEVVVNKKGRGPD